MNKLSKHSLFTGLALASIPATGFPTEKTTKNSSL